MAGTQKLHACLFLFSLCTENKDQGCHCGSKRLSQLPWLPVSPRSSHTNWLGSPKPAFGAVSQASAPPCASPSSIATPSPGPHDKGDFVKSPSQSLFCPNVSSIKEATPSFEPCCTEAHFHPVHPHCSVEMGKLQPPDQIQLTTLFCK